MLMMTAIVMIIMTITIMTATKNRDSMHLPNKCGDAVLLVRMSIHITKYAKSITLGHFDKNIIFALRQL